jgi:hypothetical protein
MVITDKILEYFQRLPASRQSEALDYIEFLLAKAEGEACRHEELSWSNLSLASAMRGMEAEDSSLYSLADLKEHFG